jgi:hypothetical protein
LPTAANGNREQDSIVMETECDVLRIAMREGCFSIDAADWERKFSLTLRSGVVVNMRPCDVRWFAWQAKHCKYVRSTVRVGETQKSVKLHRLLMEVSTSELVDHRDGDTLNNSRSNLRVATHSESNANRAITNKFGFKGVAQRLSDGMFVAKTKKHERCYWAGPFESVLEAAVAYDRLALQHHGEFARLNFPNETVK